MRQDLLNYVRTLSHLDRKSLSQKVLKLMEEAGELAKAALPFENAGGTTHRFVTGEKILEESVDSILVALSIAYTLGYTDDDIAQEMKRKSDYWAELQARESRMTERTPYEIHITIESAPSLDAFIQTCRALEVKPIVLALQRHQNGPIRDVMTSSVCFGQNSDAYQEMQRIAAGLADAGFKVVRRKIETVPWHPAAPSKSSSNQAMPAACYFECHLAVRVQDETEQARLGALAHAEGCHLSRNAFKTYEDGSATVMMTYRTYEGVYEDVQARVAELKAILTANAFPVDKEVIEFSLFDSKVTHDAAWLRA